MTFEIKSERYDKFQHDTNRRTNKRRHKLISSQQDKSCYNINRSLMCRETIMIGERWKRALTQNHQWLILLTGGVTTNN